MKTQMFTVYDAVAARFLDPFHAPTVESAIRRFRHTVNQEGNDFNLFPEDYSLFHIGEFDPEDGTLSALATPHSLGVAITFKNAPALVKAD